MTDFVQLDPNDGVVVSISDDRNELVAAECRVLTGVDPVQGIAAGGSTAHIGRAAYQQFGLQVLASAPDLQSLCEQAAALQAMAPPFVLHVYDLNRSGECASLSYQRAFGVRVTFPL